jgi:hypothetical protein
VCGWCGSARARAEIGPDSVVIRCEGCGARLFACDLGDAEPVASPERDLLSAASPAAQVLYDFIRRFERQHGYAPTLRQMRDGLGWGSPNSVTYYLNQLAAAGLIERDYGAARGIRLVRAP